MTATEGICGSIFQNGTAILLARIVNNEGQTITTDDVATIYYTVYEANNKSGSTPVVGHNQVELSTSTITDALQTGPIWTMDDIGYNFRHQIDISLNEAFPKSNTSYLVLYQLTPINGSEITFEFRLKSL